MCKGRVESSPNFSLSEVQFLWRAGHSLHAINSPPKEFIHHC